MVIENLSLKSAYIYVCISVPRSLKTRTKNSRRERKTLIEPLVGTGRRKKKGTSHRRRNLYYRHPWRKDPSVNSSKRANVRR